MCFYGIPLPGECSDHSHRRRLGKVKGMSLPQEVQLSRVIANVSNPAPSWNTFFMACEWAGVGCDAQLQVERIDWSSSRLTATGLLQGTVALNLLPESVRSFNIGNNELVGMRTDLDSLPPGLVKLEMYSNLHHGPLSLSGLPNTLRELSFSRNCFHGTLTVDTVPTSLRVLDASYNNFKELIVKELPKLLQIDVVQNVMKDSEGISRIYGADSFLEQISIEPQRIDFGEKQDPFSDSIVF